MVDPLKMKREESEIIFPAASDKTEGRKHLHIAGIINPIFSGTAMALFLNKENAPNDPSEAPNSFWVFCGETSRSFPN